MPFLSSPIKVSVVDKTTTCDEDLPYVEQPLYVNDPTRRLLCSFSILRLSHCDVVLEGENFGGPLISSSLLLRPIDGDVEN